MRRLFRRPQRDRDRRAADLARALAALDSLACDARPWKPRRVVRMSIGSAR